MGRWGFDEKTLFTNELFEQADSLQISVGCKFITLINTRLVYFCSFNHRQHEIHQRVG